MGLWNHVFFLKINALTSEIVCVGALKLCQEEQRLALSSSAGSPTDSVHKLVAPLRRIELDDPVNVWDVDAPRCQVCRQQ